MLAADPAAYVDDVQLATGTLPFVHGLRLQAALDDFYAREDLLIARVAAKSRESPPSAPRKRIARAAARGGELRRRNWMPSDLRIPRSDVPPCAMYCASRIIRSHFHAQ